jgi:biopolymer transport protein TolQ
VEQEIALTAATAPDYSVWGLVVQADIVVKSVMLLLVIASVACWAFIFREGH